jgi:hypothetical protein
MIELPFPKFKSVRAAGSGPLFVFKRRARPSLRRFNAVLAEVYRRSPTDIRQARRSVRQP